MAAFNPRDSQGLKNLIQILMKNHGKANLKQVETLCRTPNINIQDPEEVLSQYPEIFSIVKDSVQTQVRLNFQIPFCQAHSSKKGCNRRACNELHICKFFVLSSCRFQSGASSCQYGHDLMSQHNLRVFQSFFIDDLKEAEIIKLLKKYRTSSSVPDTCKFYNIDSGCTAKDGKCPALHVCAHFLSDNCKFGDRCKRSHNINVPQCRELLEKYGFNLGDPNSVLKKLRHIFQARDLVTQTSSLSVAGSPTHVKQPAAAGGAIPKHKGPRTRTLSAGRQLSSEESRGASAAVRERQNSRTSSESEGDAMTENGICLYYLRGKCQFDSSCKREHPENKAPFLWQYRDAQKWVAFSNEANMELELNYSDATRNECYQTLKGTVYHLDFDKMKMFPGDIDIRRLSTISWVKAAPHHIGVTTWSWYWQAQADKWIEYGEPDHKGYKSDIDSRVLEELYQEHRRGQHVFANDHYKYKIDFQTMMQTNLKIGTQRPMRRRPKFREKIAIPTPVAEDITLPETWENLEQLETNESGYILVKLQKSQHSAEMETVKKLFLTTLPKSKIVGIERVQNKELWCDFMRMKQKMARKTGGAEPREEQLFHGTCQSSMNAICQQGFDWRISGLRVGTLYGKGSYFSKCAKYSSDYSDCDRMFVVKVLVGDFTRGDPDYTRPPPKDPSKQFENFYDSCVDSASNPKIFVVFERSQAYVDYIVHYNKK